MLKVSRYARSHHLEGFAKTGGGGVTLRMPLLFKREYFVREFKVRGDILYLSLAPSTQFLVPGATLGFEAWWNHPLSCRNTSAASSESMLLLQGEYALAESGGGGHCLTGCCSKVFF